MQALSQSRCIQDASLLCFSPSLVNFRCVFPTGSYRQVIKFHGNHCDFERVTHMQTILSKSDLSNSSSEKTRATLARINITYSSARHFSHRESVSSRNTDIHHWHSNSDVFRVEYLAKRIRAPSPMKIESFR